MFKLLYEKFWYPVFGKILYKFVFLIEGKKNSNKKVIDKFQKKKD
tara:strand:- start:140 stop:274 length:135 start_codon:yes stop_codon:yes gene_type:complete